MKVEMKPTILMRGLVNWLDALQGPARIVWTSGREFKTKAGRVSFETYPDDPYVGEPKEGPFKLRVDWKRREDEVSSFVVFALPSRWLTEPWTVDHAELDIEDDGYCVWSDRGDWLRHAAGRCGQQVEDILRPEHFDN